MLSRYEVHCRHAVDVIVLQDTSPQTVGRKPEVKRFFSAPLVSDTGSGPPPVPRRVTSTTSHDQSHTSLPVIQLGGSQAADSGSTRANQVAKKLGIPSCQQVSLHHTASAPASVQYREVDNLPPSVAQPLPDLSQHDVPPPVPRHQRRAYSIKYVEVDFSGQPSQSQLFSLRGSDYKTPYAQIDHVISDEDGRDIPIIIDNDTSSDEDFDCNEPLSFTTLQQQQSPGDNMPRFIRARTPLCLDPTCESDLPAPSHSEFLSQRLLTLPTKGHRAPPSVPQTKPFYDHGIPANEGLEEVTYDYQPVDNQNDITRHSYQHDPFTPEEPIPPPVPERPRSE